MPFIDLANNNSNNNASDPANSNSQSANQNNNVESQDKVNNNQLIDNTSPIQPQPTPLLQEDATQVNVNQGLPRQEMVANIETEQSKQESITTNFNSNQDTAVSATMTEANDSPNEAGVAKTIMDFGSPEVVKVQEAEAPSVENSIPVTNVQQQENKPKSLELRPVTMNSQDQSQIPPVESVEETTLDQSNNQDKEVSVPESINQKIYSLEDIILDGMQKGVSDIHLSIGSRALGRVDGNLEQLTSHVLTSDDLTSYATEILKKKNINLDEAVDVDLSYSPEEIEVRFRVNVFRQNNKLAIVLRLIQENIRTIEELNLPSIARDMTQFPQGLVLVTGPTGSGKSTTLAAMVNEINNTKPKHILTIEDPIEYIFPQGLALVDQRAIGIDTDNWGTALKSALRQDPDVVMVGEIRDMETMQSALQLAETGHLVFSTLHTNSASQTINRIIDAFPEEMQNQVRNQLATVLKGVISQRLVPKIGGGRVAAVEVLVFNPAVSNAIRDDKVYQIDNIIQTGAEQGMITMEKSLVDLVKAGSISLEMAKSFSNKPEEIESMMNKF